MDAKNDVNKNQSRTYVEVIGDTVYDKHLIATICISLIFSLGAFLIGKNIFPRFAPETMVQSYSLLLGIAGSLVGLVVNALLFKPKRTLSESANTSEELKEVYDELQFDLAEERIAILNDPVLHKEMKELGIAEMYLAEKEDPKN
ncbi:hypothetical protein [Oceanobacillus chungangensis]|uniref:Uncharacterized protein n=1 Tax=Oceanobacillus chungangensis TaxID=1229152 RepID=A0A3D8PJ25_9BACI|nr:hypothetical protein [Oceanobacillus chungangensis]RDW15477.1 hypothetical protein CWR45_16980 [Oceanobacillus chungangensis]